MTEAQEPEVQEQVESTPAIPPTPYQALEAYRNIDDIRKRHEGEKGPLLEQLRLKRAKVPHNEEEIQRISAELREKNRAYSRYQKELERRALSLGSVILSITQDILRASPHDEMKNLGADLCAGMFKKERVVTFNGDLEALKAKLANVKSTHTVLDENPFDRSPLDDKIRRSARAIVEEYQKRQINAFSLDILRQVLEEFNDEIIIHDERWPACEQAINAVLKQSLPDDQAKQAIYFELQKMVTYKGPGQQGTDFFDPKEAVFTIRECVEWSLQKVKPDFPILEKGACGKQERKQYAKKFIEYFGWSSVIIEEEEEPEQSAAQVIEQFEKEVENLPSSKEARSLLVIQIEQYLSSATTNLDCDTLSWDEEKALKDLIKILKAPIDQTIQEKRRKLGLPIAAGLALATALGGAGIFLGRDGSQPEHQAAPTQPAALLPDTPDCPLPETFSLIVEKAGKSKRPRTWVYTLASLPPGHGAWELDPHVAYGQLVVICPQFNDQGNPIGTIETVYKWDALSKSPRDGKLWAGVKAGHFKVIEN